VQFIHVCCGRWPRSTSHQGRRTDIVFAPRVPNGTSRGPDWCNAREEHVRRVKYSSYFELYGITHDVHRVWLFKVFLQLRYYHIRYAIGGVMVIVLTIGPMVRGLKPDWGWWFFKSDKICCMTSFGGEVKLTVPCRKILLHVKYTYSMKDCCSQNLKEFSPSFS
jgi:hypothetical protein